LNPYKILDVSTTASKEEIKEAYKNILEKYNNLDTDGEDFSLAEDLINEANLAYEILVNGSLFKEIRSLIDNNSISLAESKLNLLDLKESAEWNYLKGFVYFKKGWFDNGIQHIITATEIDPENGEYSKTLEILKLRASDIINYYKKTTQTAPPQGNMNACGGGGAGGGGNMLSGGGNMC